MAVIDAAPPVDAAVDAAVDAGPSAALATAPAWIFRYDAPPRIETWTLRTHEGQALVTVETTAAVVRYLGTVVTGDGLALDVASPTARLTLTCKPASRPIGATCAARKPPTLEVLDCFHPDFASPMTFARAPGVVYDAACPGYRRLP